jgi:NADPH-dependent 2,4-dienoyl-CoA reductase/sulfur reductase-like enzyme
VDGWIPVDLLTRDALPGVFAVGDVTSVGTLKAGYSPKVRPLSSPTASLGLRADGVGTVRRNGTLSRIRDGWVARGRTFLSWQSPSGRFDEPSMELAADKADFAPAGSVAGRHRVTGSR